ncbi:hypothetical protein M0805_008955 [Coniferiporia weirii]|nr:hypothetical protein M0805_008955 [Coniferiporia weirii]
MASFLASRLPQSKPLFSALLTHPPSGPSKQVTYKYFVPRNSRGSLPVYSDIRNGGTRHLVLVKNIRGNVNTLRDDLASSLFESGAPDAARLKTHVVRTDTLVISGGRWKLRVMDWLRSRGF